MIRNSRNNRADANQAEDLYPTTELERAYVQARNWTPIHSWRRGTSHLNAGRYAQAMGVYLAMIRQQMLTGLKKEVRTSLLSLVQFTNYSETVDKIAVVRILSDTLAELNQSEFNNSHKDQVGKSFQEVISIFIDELKDDKTATLKALACVKQSSEFKFVAPRSFPATNKTELQRLWLLIEKNELRLAELHISHPDEKDREKQRELIAEDTLEELCKTSGSSKLLYLLKSSCMLFVKRNERENVSTLCALLLKYVDHCNQNVDEVDLSHFTSHSTNQHVRPLETQSKIFDTMISSLLEQLASDLIHQQYIVAASKCLQRCLFAAVRLNNFPCATKDLLTIASAALISKTYSDASELLQMFFETINDLDGPSNFPVETETFASRLSHLLENLINPKRKLDQGSLTSLNDVALNVTKVLDGFIASPLYHEIILLLRNRTTSEKLIDALPNFWKTTTVIRQKDYFSVFIQPLAVITEQTFDSKDSSGFEHYKRSASAIKSVHDFDGTDRSQLALFWRVLIDEREKKEGFNSYTLLPLLGELATLYSLEKEFEQAEKISRRILAIDKACLHAPDIDKTVVSDCVGALLLTTAIWKKLKKTQELLKSIQQIEKIIDLNLDHKPTLLLLHVTLLVHLEHFPEDTQTLSPLLDKIDKRV